jgi:ketol-acid reductoisomerase
MRNNFQVGIIGSGGQYQRISKILRKKKLDIIYINQKIKIILTKMTMKN